MNWRGRVRILARQTSSRAALALSLLGPLAACASLGAPASPDKKLATPAPPDSPSRSRPPRPLKPRPVNRLVTGVITGLDGAILELDGRPLRAISRRLLQGLSIGDQALVTLRGEALVALKIFPKLPQRARRSKPKAPPVGAFVMFDLLRGRVIAVDGDHVTLELWEAGQAIGESQLKIRANTVLRQIDDPLASAAARKPATPERAQESDLPTALPSDGPLAKPMLVIRPSKGVLPAPTLTALGGRRESEDVYRLALRLENPSHDKALESYELSLDFVTERGLESFGCVLLSRPGEALAPGATRTVVLSAQSTLPDPPKSVRVTLSELRYR